MFTQISKFLGQIKFSHQFSNTKPTQLLQKKFRPLLESLEERLTPASGIFKNQVSNLYQIVLHRAADQDGLRHFTSLLEQGRSLTQVSLDLFSSNERNTLMVREYYKSLLNRSPDKKGLDTFVAAADRGLSEKDVVASFVASPEFSGGLNNKQFVSEMYYVILNRKADPAGLNAFSGLLESGKTRGQVAKALLDNPEFSGRVVNNVYSNLLGRNAQLNEAKGWTVEFARPSVDIRNLVAKFSGSDEGKSRLGTAELGTKLSTDFWWQDFVGISLNAARQSLQQTSNSFQSLIIQRNTAVKANNEIQIRNIDTVLGKIDAKRYQALAHVVLADNPTAKEVNREAHIFSVPVPGDGHGANIGYSSPLVAWHAENLSPINGQFKDLSLGIYPDQKFITSNQTLAGSSNWSSFYPYTGDYDYSEEWDIKAPDANTAAGWAVTAILNWAVGQSQTTQPNFEFWRLRINYKKPDGTSTNGVWTPARLLAAVNDPAEQEQMKAELMALDGGRISINFRALLNDGRFTHMQKVIGLHAYAPSGESLFDSEIPYPYLLDGDILFNDSDTFFRSQIISGEFQEIYVFGLPSPIDPELLGEYASTMARLVDKETTKDQRYLKAANRSFAYFRAIGNIEGMEAIKPVYTTNYSLMNQRMQMLDTIADALDPKFPSMILTAAKAREQMLSAANDITSLENGSLAATLRGLAARVEGINGISSFLKPDSQLAAELQDFAEITLTEAINTQVKGIILPVIEKYLSPFLTKTRSPA